MQKLFVYLLLSLLSYPLLAADIFDKYGQRYDIDPDLLRSIATTESNTHHWSLNINRESVVCQDKRGVVNTLRRISKNNVLLVAQNNRYKPLRWNCVYNKEPNLIHRWLPSVNAAKLFANKYNLKIIRISKKKVISTDIGLMQINWLWHKDEIKSINKLLNINFNVNYSAKLLQSLIKKHGLTKAIGFYHNQKSIKRQIRYRNTVLNHYQKLKRQRGHS